MHVYRVVVPDITYYVDIGSDDFKMPVTDCAATLVLAETHAKARYRGLAILGLLPGQYDTGWPPKVSCVCTRKNVVFDGMADGMNVSSHTEWWEKEDETAEVQCETVGQGNLCE